MPGRMLTSRDKTVVKIKGLFRLIRFELPFSAGICVVLGQVLALGEQASAYVTITGFLSVFMISASILVLNDYFDVETDRINSPDRPIPSNLVTPNQALWLSILLMISGLILSYLISITSLVISICLTVIGFLYNRRYKQSGLPGNIMVSFSVGMTFIYGGANVGSPFNKVVLFFGLIATLIDLGEEIAADAMDMEGDSIINSNSLAIKYGKTTAIKVSSIIFLLVVLFSFVPFIVSWFRLVYIIPILVMDFFIVYPVTKLIKSEEDEGRKYIRWIYLGATLGLIVFLTMRVIGV